MVWSVQSQQEREAINEILSSKSDRVLAVLGGAIVDDRLRTAIIYRLRDDSTRIDRLFDPSGPLGAFANKIDLAYLLHIYDKRTRDALSSIAKIRNYFAHSLTASFNDPNDKLKVHMGRLTLHAGEENFPVVFDIEKPNKFTKPATARDTFIINIQFALVILLRDTFAHEPHSNVAWSLSDALKHFESLPQKRAQPKRPRRK